jgi:hypothetical protein
MRSFASIKLGSLGSLSIQHSISATADRPPGISPDGWIRLDENLGIVVHAPATATATATATPTATPSRAAEPPAATGYFMVKHGGLWLRLNLE